MVERLPVKEMVPGSSPGRGAKQDKATRKFRFVFCGSSCFRFENESWFFRGFQDRYGQKLSFMLLYLAYQDSSKINKKWGLQRGLYGFTKNP